MNSQQFAYSNEMAIAAHQNLKERDYWLNRLSGNLVKSNFPYDFRKTGENERSLDSLTFTFGGELVNQLLRLSKNSDFTLNIILVAGLVVLLYKYTGNDDIIVSAPIYKQDIETRFLNTVLVLRNPVNEEETFKELLLQVSRTVSEATENYSYPLEKLQDQLNIRGSFKNSLLFETLILLENIHDENYARHIEPNSFFRFKRSGDHLEGALTYNTVLYEKTTIEKIVTYFEKLLQNLIANIDLKLTAVDLLPGEEKKRLLFDFNDTKADFPGDKTVARLFAAQVEKTPGHIAAAYENETLTYRQLNDKAHGLAGILRKKGIGPDTFVGILVERSLEMMVGIMGVTMAGGVYLPIDPDIPVDRINYMLTDSDTRILLAQMHLVHKVNFEREIVDIENIEENYEETPDLKNTGSPSGLLYVIYTSGTTGRPKGVLISNRNLINYVNWFKNLIGLTDNDKTLFTASFSFDAVYTQIYASFLNGGALHILSKETNLSAEKLLNYIKENKISYIKATPSLFSIIVNSPVFSAKMFHSVRLVVVGGEPIRVKDIEKAHVTCESAQIMNHYGPTETTIGSTAQFIDFSRFENYKKHPTIGRPIDNTRVYILDKNSMPVPSGVPGELYIGGEGLARGYLNKCELTARKFIPDPFRKGEKLYRTGDLARLHPDRNIELLGRIDDQVKISGYRIELREIESRLKAYDGIKEVLLISREDDNGTKYLCSYLVSEKEIDVPGLRTYLSARLPHYMLPRYFVRLKKIPLTQHNKVDRTRLPDPRKIAGMDNNYKAPENETQRKIIGIWAEVLGIEAKDIGIRDNFFELGGNSVNSLDVIHHIYEIFGLSIPVAELFLSPTVEGLADDIRQEKLLQGLECVMKLNRGTAGENIFIIHPGSLELFPYKKLALLLEQHYNVYGVQPRGLYREGRLPRNKKELVADYLREIKMIQKQGPYIIVGYCIGAIIAYDLVRRLEDQNETVAGLVEIDAVPFMSTGYTKYLRLKERLLKGSTKRGKKKSLTDNRKLPEIIKKEFEEQRMDRVAKNLMRLIGKISRPPRLIDSPVLLIRAKENTNPYIIRKYWERMTKGSLRFVEIQGNHQSILKVPYVNKLAKVIIKNIQPGT